MEQFEILSETENGSGWTYDVQVLENAGTLRLLHVTLSWPDYNHWSVGGADEPQRIAAGVVAFLLSRSPAAELRERFDASLARRLHDDADDRIPAFIR